MATQPLTKKMVAPFLFFSRLFFFAQQRCIAPAALAFLAVHLARQAAKIAW